MNSEVSAFELIVTKWSHKQGDQLLGTIKKFNCIYMTYLTLDHHDSAEMTHDSTADDSFVDNPWSML